MAYWLASRYCQIQGSRVPFPVGALGFRTTFPVTSIALLGLRSPIRNATGIDLEEKEKKFK